MRTPLARATAVVTATALALIALSTAASAAPGEQVDPPSWGLDRVDQRTGLDQRYHYPSGAENVTVYVIDTGVDGTLPDFGGRVLPGKDFVDDDDHATDGNGHGTQLAGIVAGERYGLAKQARVFPVRVLNDKGAGSGADIIAGLDWVRQHARQPAVAVTGVGGPPNEAIDSAVRALAEVVPLAVPAGGSGSDAGQFSPGRVPEVLTVAASDRADKVYPRSNSGAAVDLYAPGAEIVAPGLGGAEVVRSGTSMAAAHVAGAAALVRAAQPDLPAPKVAETVVVNATRDALSDVPQATPNLLLYTGP